VPSFGQILRGHHAQARDLFFVVLLTGGGMTIGKHTAAAPSSLKLRRFSRRAVDGKRPRDGSGTRAETASKRRAVDAARAINPLDFGRRIMQTARWGLSSFSR
jgi:hypothetical protein